MYWLRVARSVVCGLMPQFAEGLLRVARGLVSPVEHATGEGETWWQRPGLGVMYQVEYRPGMDWDRDYALFNREMTGENGKFEFDGPFCRVDEWVELGREAGVDYHVMEIKWHDGICYFNTELTDWKTPTDYAGLFAERSRKVGIPFMFYYSSIFDHNPMFDPIQPNTGRTISFLGLSGKAGEREYSGYVRGQYRELVERYKPDGMWFDWYWPDSTTRLTIEFFQENYPSVVLAFNASNLFPGAYSKIDYTSGEAHGLDGPYLNVLKTDRGMIVVFQSAWKLASLGRRVIGHPSELVAPVGRWWQDPSLRDDPDDLVRMAAIVMASGGKFCPGVSARLDGGLFPGHVDQMRILGKWYGPRRGLFVEAVPLRYRRAEPPGLKVTPRGMKAIACRHGGDTLLHLVNMRGATGAVALRLKGGFWGKVRSARLEPHGREIPFSSEGGATRIMISPRDVDAVDTILRLEFFAR